MKRIAVVCVALAVAGASAFAQDGLKVSGAVKTGVEITGGTKPSGDQKTDEWQAGTYRLHNDDAGVPSRADVTVTYEGETAGATATVRANWDGKGFNSTAGGVADLFLVPAAYGWYKLFDDKVEVSAGILDNKKWGTLDGFNVDDTLDNYNLFKLEIKPVEGLSFGINTFDYRNGDGEFKEAGKEPEDPKLPGNPFTNTVIGVKYVQEDSFGIAAEFVFNNWYIDTNGKGYSGIFTTNLTDSNGIKAALKKAVEMAKSQQMSTASESDFGLLASFTLGAVENLAIAADAYYAHLTPAKDASANTLGIAVQGLYSINDQLKAGAKVAFGSIDFKGYSKLGYATKDDGNADWDLVITPKAEYVLNDTVTLGLEIPIGLVDNRSAIGDGAGSSSQFLSGFDKTYLEKWHGGFNLGVKPKATFNLGELGDGAAKFVAFYRFDANTPGYYDKHESDLKYTTFDHTLQLDFIWTF